MTIWPAATSTGTPTTSSSTPTSTPPAPSESCHTKYKTLWDKFDIYGVGWDSSSLNGDGGAGSGAGLQQQLKGCSKLTKWKFESLTPGPGQPWDFHASGRLIIGEKKCIEHAMGSAGAPAENCDGSS